MQNLFYSQEQEREYYDDLHGDGYSNEYQRCYAQSAMMRPLKDERQEAARLHAQGRHVVCAEWEVCCPSTDGLIGYDWVVLNHFATEAQAQAYIGEDEDVPTGIFLYSPPPAQPKPLPAPDWDDEIPF